MKTPKNKKLQNQKLLIQKRKQKPKGKKSGLLLKN